MRSASPGARIRSGAAETVKKRPSSGGFPVSLAADGEQVFQQGFAVVHGIAPQQAVQPLPQDPGGGFRLLGPAGQQIEALLRQIGIQDLAGEGLREHQGAGTAESLPDLDFFKILFAAADGGLQQAHAPLLAAQGQPGLRAVRGEQAQLFPGADLGHAAAAEAVLQGQAGPVASQPGENLLPLRLRGGHLLRHVVQAAQELFFLRILHGLPVHRGHLVHAALLRLFAGDVVFRGHGHRAAAGPDRLLPDFPGGFRFPQGSRKGPDQG